MNAHVNLGALWCTRPAGKAGAEPVLSTPHKSPAEEGVITAEFAVALPAVTVVLALCLGAASTGVAQLRWRSPPGRQHEQPPAGIPRRRFAPQSAASIRRRVCRFPFLLMVQLMQGRSTPGRCTCG